MASVRLRADQIERLRKLDNASADIRYAVKRWKRGDIERLLTRLATGEECRGKYADWLRDYAAGLLEETKARRD